MTFKHFVFTNFGVGIKDYLWLSYRYEIFKKTIYQSIDNQLNHDFTWIIFIDDKLPYSIFEKISTDLNNLKCKTSLVKIDDYQKIVPTIKTLLKDIKENYIISTRIDDDDLLCIDAINLIHNLVKNTQLKQNVLISFKNGIEYSPIDLLARRVEYETLALGLTLISKNSSNLKIVNEFAHHSIKEFLLKVDKDAEFISIQSAEPLYIYVKHQLSDSSYIGSRARIVKDIDNFNISELNLLNIFGIKIENFNSLKLTLENAPCGMPYKYLEILGKLRGLLKKTEDIGEKNKILAKIKKYENKCTRENVFKINKKEKFRVAILGSCVTRDLFEMEKDLNDEIDIVYYNTRASVVSLTSLPNTNKKIYINNDKFEDKRAQRDLEKTYWDELENSRPDCIIVDFIDERIGIIENGGSCYTASGPMIKAFERANVQFDIKRPWEEDILEKRKFAIRIYLEKLLTISDNIFIHKCLWADEFINEKNEILSIFETKFSTLVQLNNKILNDIFENIEALNFPISFIGGNKNVMIAGGEHYWEFSPFHYDKKYYKALSDELKYQLLIK